MLYIVFMRKQVVDRLDSVTFDELVARADPFFGDECSFDLTAVKWVSPAGLVQLATTCYSLQKMGRHPFIFLGDESVASYLSRAGFVAAIRPVATIEPNSFATVPLDRLRGSNPMLIEVTKIERGRDLPALLNNIVMVLREKLKYKKRDAFDVATVISEVGQNTFDHNKETCGFIAMQVYEPRHGGSFLEIGIGDYGDGIAETLRRNPNNPVIKTDLEAIQIATKPGVSEHDDPTRGTGLYHLLEIAYKHEGMVQIRSGNGKVRYRMDKRMGFPFSVAYVPGVQIALQLTRKKR